MDTRETDELQARFKAYDLNIRAAQLEMIDGVSDALYEDRKLIIEAPTATGKSFGYILAAILANDRRRGHKQELLSTVISTATVALQEQLIFKDLPFIEKLLDRELDYRLAKGRGRFLCPRKLYTAETEDRAVNQEIQELVALYEGEDESKARWQGDFDELEKPPSKAVMAEIYNTSASCSYSRCEYFKDCPFFLARQGLRDADIIVTNHSLLLSHFALGDGAILPEFDSTQFIIDECHHLPDRALRSLSGFVSLIGSQKWINDIDKLLNSLPGELIQQQRKLQWQDVRKRLVQRLTDMQGIIHPLYQQAEKDGKTWPLQKVSDDIRLIGADIKQAADFYVSELTKLKKELDDFVDKSDIYHHGSLEKTFTQLGFLLERSENLQKVWALMLDESTSPPIAKWILPHEKEGKSDESQQDIMARSLEDYDIYASPIEAASLLQKVFWQQNKHGVILCSATVRSIGKFDRFLNATALRKQAEVMLLPSPLSFKDSSLIIPAMRHEPSYSDKHIDETITLLNTRFLHDINSGVLVLFSSIYAMERVYDGLKKEIKRITLVQGDRSKQAIIDLHKSRIDKFKPSIIFGVDSFAEGVDLPGKYLERLIIHKLPFSVPSDPIEKTRSQWLESLGRKPFMDISLPQASLKLTQMVGRLIRTESDKGEVIILDRRLVSKFYGQQLLTNLPPFKLVTE